MDAGMDTYKRRQTWDLLLRERANKTILLSTHDMEEAEVLGDHIAIMADGQVLGCCALHCLTLPAAVHGHVAVPQAEVWLWL